MQFKVLKPSKSLQRCQVVVVAPFHDQPLQLGLPGQGVEQPLRRAGEELKVSDSCSLAGQEINPFPHDLAGSSGGVSASALSASNPDSRLAGVFACFHQGRDIRMWARRESRSELCQSGLSTAFPTNARTVACPDTSLSSWPTPLASSRSSLRVGRGRDLRRVSRRTHH